MGSARPRDSTPCSSRRQPSSNAPPIVLVARVAQGLQADALWAAALGCAQEGANDQMQLPSDPMRTWSSPARSRTRVRHRTHVMMAPRLPRVARFWRNRRRSWSGSPAPTSSITAAAPASSNRSAPVGRPLRSGAWILTHRSVVTPLNAERNAVETQLQQVSADREVKKSGRMRRWPTSWPSPGGVARRGRPTAAG